MQAPATTVRVGIINYGLGNLTSVANALGSIGVDYTIAETPPALGAATHIILPGVGSFTAGMSGLRSGGWIEPLREQVIQQKKPLLGICLGMQLLADKGFENEESEGLSFIPGRVEKIPAAEHHLPLPHIGWNSVELMPGKKIVAGLSKDPDFYFVHSYRLIPTDKGVIAGTAEYGVPMVALIESGNIFGVQFHPEKSQGNGICVLKNFIGISIC